MRLERQVVVRCRQVAREFVVQRAAARRNAGPDAILAAGALARAAAPAAEELHGLGDDLGRVALLPFLVRPLARLQAALDVDRAALVQVLPAVLRGAAPGDDAVPLGPLLGRLPVLAPEALVRVQREVG